MTKHDFNFTPNNWRNSPIFFPFIFGVFFLIVLLILAIVLKDPTKYQYNIFKTIIALAGAAFAVSLTGGIVVNMPLFRKGYVKASMGFAVFVILFFFSPAALVVDDAKIKAQDLINELLTPGTEVYMAFANLEKIWRSPELVKIFRQTKPPTEESLDAADKAMRDKLSEASAQQSFKVLVEYFDRVSRCNFTDGCDQNELCGDIFLQTEEFRTFYCGEIYDIDFQTARRLGEQLYSFAINTCRSSFLNKYVKIENGSFKQSCIPTQCWALNKKPPYPCQVKRQIDVGMVLPS